MNDMECIEQFRDDLADMTAERDALKTKLKRLHSVSNRKPGVFICPPIVCLCGSTRFMEAFFDAGWKFTLEGEIVLSVGVCKHAEHHGAEALGQDVADRLDELHMRKIDLADHVHILNVGGYIGESMRKELNYAIKTGKLVTFLEEPKYGIDGSRRWE